MATYAIGDIQGCFDEFQELLTVIRFDPESDRLWLVGDLVNRGPASLETLRHVRALGARVTVTLGNHDLHLIATAAGARPLHRRDTFEPVLQAPDGEQLLEWLRHRDVLHRDPALGFVAAHAGIPPAWTLDEAEQRAAELEAALRGDDHQAFLHQMYGNQPDRWDDALTGFDRLRFITNGLTRMRYCDSKGRLDFDEERLPGKQSKKLVPWFTLRGADEHRIVFGHWATLQAEAPLSPRHGVFHVDHGCVWGGRLSALRLEDLHWFHVESRQRPGGLRA